LKISRVKLLIVGLPISQSFAKVDIKKADLMARFLFDQLLN